MTVRIKATPAEGVVLSRGRGKPRRGTKACKSTSVRIDPDSKRILQREFGSLGNALFYLAGGIKQFRSRFRIDKHIDAVRDQSAELSAHPELSQGEILLVSRWAGNSLLGGDLNRLERERCLSILAKISLVIPLPLIEDSWDGKRKDLDGLRDRVLALRRRLLDKAKPIR